MNLLIVRHGKAVDAAPGLGDAGRWLTGKGRRVTRRVAQWLVRREERRPAAIWTSPLVRAVQTAEILAEAAALTGEVSVAAELMPGRDAREVVKLLAAEAQEGPLALVGHEPLLSEIVATLIGDPTFAGIRKSGVVGLTWSPVGRSALQFVLEPKQVE